MMSLRDADAGAKIFQEKNCPAALKWISERCDFSDTLQIAQTNTEKTTQKTKLVSYVPRWKKKYGIFWFRFNFDLLFVCTTKVNKAEEYVLEYKF